MALELRRGVTLYFSRHGQTEANVGDLFCGKHHSPLTEKGRGQAHQVGLILGRELAAAGTDPATMAFVASPLTRARTTMEIARGAMGLPAAGYTTEDRIQEIDLGAWDLLSQAEARALDPAYYDRRLDNRWTIPAPGGETYEQMAARAADWAQGLTRDTFAVTHGAFSRTFRGLLAGMDIEGMSALDEPQGVIFRVRGSEAVRFDP